jgi:hypothetical protein
MAFHNIYWVEAIMITNYFQNQNPTKALNEKFTPYQSWVGVKLDFSKIQKLNCWAFVLIQKSHHTKS